MAEPLLRREPTEPMPGPLVLDLIAAVVQGGAAPDGALRSVGSALRSAGDPRGEILLRCASELHLPAAITTSISDQGFAAAATDADLRLIAGVLDALRLAARAGLPPTVLVRASAAEERRRTGSARLKAIRRLEVLLVIPAGLCLLPAFVLLGIVPLVIDLVVG